MLRVRQNPRATDRCGGTVTRVAWKAYYRDASGKIRWLTFRWFSYSYAIGVALAFGPGAELMSGDAACRVK